MTLGDPCGRVIRPPEWSQPTGTLARKDLMTTHRPGHAGTNITRISMYTYTLVHHTCTHTRSHMHTNHAYVHIHTLSLHITYVNINSSHTWVHTHTHSYTSTSCTYRHKTCIYIHITHTHTYLKRWRVVKENSCGIHIHLLAYTNKTSIELRGKWTTSSCEVFLYVIISWCCSLPFTKGSDNKTSPQDADKGFHTAWGWRDPVDIPRTMGLGGSGLEIWPEPPLSNWVCSMWSNLQVPRI